MLLIVCRLIIINESILPGMTISERFGETVRELRLRKGWSQEELAAQSGLHRTYIGSVERGERNITLESADRIAKALESTLHSCVKEAEKSGKK